MDKSVINTIGTLRAENYTYASIGRALNMSTNTVKAVCRRHEFTPKEGTQKKNVNKAAQIVQLTRCKYCETILNNPWNRKGKVFCCDKCRYAWWNSQKQSEKSLCDK